MYKKGGIIRRGYYQGGGQYGQTPNFFDRLFNTGKRKRFSSYKQGRKKRYFDSYGGDY